MLIQVNATIYNNHPELRAGFSITVDRYLLGGHPNMTKAELDTLISHLQDLSDKMALAEATR